MRWQALAVGVAAKSAPCSFSCCRINSVRDVKEWLEEASMTRHEPSITTTGGAKHFLEQQADAAVAVVTAADTISEASLKIHREVAQIASNSFENAVQESIVLSNTIHYLVLTICFSVKIANVAASGDDSYSSEDDDLNPRALLTKHHKRIKSGTHRYAVKFLRSGIQSDMQRYAVGTVDLVPSTWYWRVCFSQV